MAQTVLTINAGSSSIKFALFEAPSQADGAARPTLQISGMLERIGQTDSTVAWRVPGESEWRRQAVSAATNEAAVEPLRTWLDSHVGIDSICAVGHRVVHGGPTYAEPVRVTPAVIAE